MTSRRQVQARHDGAFAVGAIGGGLLLAGVGYVLLADFTGEDPLMEVVLEVVLVVGVPAVILYAAAWLARSSLGNGHRWQAAQWSATGLATLAVLANGLVWHQYWEGVVVQQPVFLFLALGNIGAGAGALTGITRAQAVRSARRAERARTAADLAEQERKRLRYLNHVLRHHVLNGMNVIRGHADRLDQQVGAANREDVEPILRRSDRIVELVQNVRTLVQSLEDEFDPKPVSLREVLESELVAARTANPNADIDVVGSVPAVDVRADESLPLLFENLLSNAVEHNDAPVPAVQVSVEKQGIHVVVRVADNGPGIPEEVVQDLRRDPADLARGETVGLYLVRVLVDRYDGDIWPERTDASGTTVAVKLPVDR